MACARLLGAGLVVASVVVVGSTGGLRAGTKVSCAASGVRAVVLGVQVCLKVGERCLPQQAPIYRRHGFTCGVRGRLARIATPPPSEMSQLNDSLYLSLSNDRVVKERSVLLSGTITLARPDRVFLETDGTAAPIGGDAAASVFVQVDGARVSNASTIDWRGSSDPVRTSFDAIGVLTVSGGTHTVELVGDPLSGTFEVSASSNLSVLVHPAQSAAAAQVAGTAGPFDFTTFGLVGPDLPHIPLVTLPTGSARPTVALAAATGRRAGHDGDGMLGVYLDGQHPGPAWSSWTESDICSCAAVEEPLFSDALLTGGNGGSSVSLDATEFPWTLPGPPREDPANYVVPAGATLVALGGGMRLVGSAPSQLPSFPDELGTVSDYWCIGSTSGFPGCPSTGAPVLLAEATVIVPRGDPGVLMLIARTRVQGDASDPGGAARLWVAVDGTQRGSVGVQQLAAPFSVSSRTIGASYLAAGNGRLAPGAHLVQVYGEADGTFVHLTFVRDLPLLWFD